MESKKKREIVCLFIFYKSNQKRLQNKSGYDKISLNKILGADEDLCKEIEYFSEAEKALLENWKLPLEIILHRQHYKKER